MCYLKENYLKILQYIYIIQVKLIKHISGQFGSILNVMVRVPNLKDSNIKWNKKTIQNFRNIVINELKNIDGLENIENEILYESYLTPVHIKVQVLLIVMELHLD